MTSVASEAPRERLLALDVFRGATVAGMLLVNNPGTWGAIFPPLEHAAWNGWTPTDLIFPFFLFIAGITTHLSLSGRRARGATESDIQRQIIRRGVMIVGFGLMVGVFPFYDLARWQHVRIPGVLQRIGVAYTLSALITGRLALRPGMVDEELLLDAVQWSKRLLSAAIEASARVGEGLRVLAVMESSEVVAPGVSGR
jgi:predicted acyltransferase